MLNPMKPRSSSGRTIGFILLAALMAAMLAWGPYARGHNADSLVPVLESLYAWQPFFWGQTRFGMLVPLIALPVNSPFWNLLIQSWLNALGGILAFYLAAKYADRIRWKGIGTLALGAFLLLAPWPARVFFQLVPVHGPSLALCMGALILWDARLHAAVRWPGGAALMVLAAWVNIAMPVVAGGILVGRALVEVREKRQDGLTRLLPRLSIVAAAFILIKFLAGPQAPGVGWDVVLSSPREIITSCWGLAATAVGSFWPLGLCVAGALPPVILWTRRRIPLPLWDMVPLIAGAVAYLGVLGLLAWPSRNEYGARYLLPAAVLCVVGACAVIGRLLPRALGSRLVGMGALTLILIILCGIPTPAKARSGLDEMVGRTREILGVGRAREILAVGATHVAGDYWNVWPAVYHANLVLTENAEGRRVWGITARCKATRPLWDWRPLDQWVIAQDASEAEDVARCGVGYYAPWVALGAPIRSDPSGRALHRIRVFRAQPAVWRADDEAED